MENKNIDLFKGHQYISLETYRKSGEAVRTPVWFAQEDGRLYVWTFGGSGKAKRIRRSAQVKVAPADRTGNPLGPYVMAEARVNAIDTPAYQHGNHLMNRKYGLMKHIFGLLGGKNNADRVIIEVKLQE